MSITADQKFGNLKVTKFKSIYKKKTLTHISAAQMESFYEKKNRSKKSCNTAPLNVEDEMGEAQGKNGRWKGLQNHHSNVVLAQDKNFDAGRAPTSSLQNSKTTF
jgi:hypothetical protein